MQNPKVALSPDEYRNYRNIRAVALLYIVLGVVLAMGGLVLMFDEADAQKTPEVTPALAGIVAAIGVCGVVGGIAVRNGSRRLAAFAMVMGAFYVLAFPIGTILSVVLFTGGSRYFKSVERLRAPSA